MSGKFHSELRGGSPCLHTDLLHLGSLSQSSRITRLEEPQRSLCPHPGAIGPHLAHAQLQETKVLPVSRMQAQTEQRKGDLIPQEAPAWSRVLMRHAPPIVPRNPRDSLEAGD